MLNLMLIFPIVFQLCRSKLKVFQLCRSKLKVYYPFSLIPPPLLPLPSLPLLDLKKKVSEATNRFFEARIAVMGFRCKVMQLQGELEKKKESSPVSSGWQHYGIVVSRERPPTE